MLILAGVSINALVGDNGIITNAQKAKELSQKASELEDLQIALVNYSASAYMNEEESLDNVVNGLLRQKLIDWVDGTKDGSGNYIDYNQYEDENNNRYVWVKKGDNSYRIYLNDDDTYSADEMPLAGGGTLKGGTYMVTKDAFSSGAGVTDPNERGKFTVEGDTKIVFNEPLGVKDDGITASDDMLSIFVKTGSNVKIYFNDNPAKRATADNKTHYYLTNQGLKRSAIEIQPGAELTLVISENVVVNVDSGFGEDASETTPGKGGYAGIRVPWIDTNENNEIDSSDSYATLNLKGKGMIIATGGQAGNGASASPGAGGGGAGAGIGGNRRKWYKRRYCCSWPGWRNWRKLWNR